MTIRESTFIMPRGDEDIKGGAPKYFPALKGGGSIYWRGGGYKIFNVLVQQGPECSLPLSRNLVSARAQINHKKLYYNYYTSGKFLTLKFKFQVNLRHPLPQTSDALLRPWWLYF